MIKLTAPRFGGSDQRRWFNDVWEYDSHSNIWTELSAASESWPRARSNHASALVNGIMYIFGGRDSMGNALGDLIAFNFETRCWYNLDAYAGTAPTPRWGHTMTVDSTRIVLLGGRSSGVSEQKGDWIHTLETWDTNQMVATPQHSPVGASPFKYHTLDTSAWTSSKEVVISNGTEAPFPFCLPAPQTLAINLSRAPRNLIPVIEEFKQKDNSDRSITYVSNEEERVTKVKHLKLIYLKLFTSLTHGLCVG